MSSEVCCAEQGSASRVREVILLLCLAVGCCVSFWAPQYMTCMDILEWVQKMATQMMDWRINMRGETERAGTVRPGEEKALEDLTSVCKCLMWGLKRAETFFSAVHCDRRRGNGHKLKYGKLHKRKHFFFTMKIKQQSRLSRESWKTRWGAALSIPLQLTLFWTGELN